MAFKRQKPFTRRFVMTEQKFTNRADAKRAGYFSRRHKNSDAHIEAKERWFKNHPHKLLKKQQKNER